MATVTALSRVPAEHRGITHWMERVVKELGKLRKSPDQDAVHDLRVAIRRCRSVAAVMREVDPHPSWKELRRIPKKLFRKLGELRDTQVMDAWVKEHGAENDKLRGVLHDAFQAKEPALLKQTLKLANKFDEKKWTRLERKLRQRMRLVPAGSLAAQCLAVERLQEAKELHAKALRAQKPESWHGLRIGLKKFRYTVESLLPQQYASWSPQLKRLQDILGEVHDLDVLRAIIKERPSSDTASLQAEWERTIERERGARLEEYRELAVGKESVWQDWGQALPQQERLQLAGVARLRATARAMEAHPQRAACVSRLSIGLFDALGRERAAAVFESHEMRRILRAAARLSGVRVKGAKGSAQKAARNFLLGLPAPPAWTREQWQLLAWTVRYHRGSEPKARDNAFARLQEEQRTNVRALAGIIRLGRGLRKCGIQDGSRFRVEENAATMTLHVPGLVDSTETAVRLAGAKHLLESYLGKPVIVKAAKRDENVLQLPFPEQLDFRVSAASD